jgi:hypothetical protein
VRLDAKAIVTNPQPDDVAVRYGIVFFFYYARWASIDGGES